MCWQQWIRHGQILPRFALAPKHFQASVFKWSSFSKWLNVSDLFWCRKVPSIAIEQCIHVRVGGKQYNIAASSMDEDPQKRNKKMSKCSVQKSECPRSCFFKSAVQSYTSFIVFFFSKYLWPWLYRFKDWMGFWELLTMKVYFICYYQANAVLHKFSSSLIFVCWFLVFFNVFVGFVAGGGSQQATEGGPGQTESGAEWTQCQDGDLRLHFHWQSC